MPSTATAYRHLTALLGVLQGTPASGQLTVASTGATGVVPGGAFAAPIVGGELREDLVLVVTEESSVTSAGSSIAVASVQSGSAVNLSAGTQVRWDPELSGIEPVSAVAAGGLTGGTQLDTLGALRSVRAYKDLGSRPQAREFWQAAGATDTPAAILQWSRSGPADGTSQMTSGPKGTRRARGVTAWRDEWKLLLVTSRLDGSDQRRREGDVLRDDVLELLSDRQAYRGLTVSDDPGLQILDVGQLSLNATTWVDVVTFATVRNLSRRDLHGSFDDWLRTRIRVPIQDEVGLDDAGDLVDVTDPGP